MNDNDDPIYRTALNHATSLVMELQGLTIGEQVRRAAQSFFTPMALGCDQHEYVALWLEKNHPLGKDRKKAPPL